MGNNIVPVPLITHCACHLDLIGMHCNCNENVGSDGLNNEPRKLDQWVEVAMLSYDLHVTRF